MNTINNKTIPNIEGLSTMDNGSSIVGTKLIDNINDFKKQYKSYLDCTSINGNATVCMNNYNFVTSYVNALNTANMKDNVVYNDSNRHISNTYASIVKGHDELERKMKELYKTNDSLYNSDYKVNYDATMLTGIIWSVLAGSILYYSFTKL